MKKPLTTLAAIAAFALGSLAGARAEGMLGGQIVVPDSGLEAPTDIGQNAHTNYKLFIPRRPFASPDAAPGNQTAGSPPYADYPYETPASLGCVYGLVANETAGAAPACNPYVVGIAPNIGAGASRTIAIVDAYHYPTALADLTKFSTQFGLPAPNFSYVYASGSQPRGNSSWNIEEALDIEWAHAMAPAARIYLVEARSNSYADMLTAVDAANRTLGSTYPGVVSMSWGGSEFAGETAYDANFNYSNIVYFAATGDSPGVIWPSTSPNVVAVGGTSTSRSSSYNFLSQTTWQDGGGGPSLYETQPSFQAGAVAPWKFAKRATPDVSADANPSTGVYVYEAGSWYAVGGTSVATPIWAGIVSAAGASSSTLHELTTIYPEASNASDFDDIRTGSCGPGDGYSAVAGWDPCTGVGAPNTLLGK